MGTKHQAAGTGISIFTDSNAAGHFLYICCNLDRISSRVSFRLGFVLIHNERCFRGAGHILYMRVLPDSNTAALINVVFNIAVVTDSDMPAGPLLDTAAMLYVGIGSN